MQKSQESQDFIWGKDQLSLEKASRLEDIHSSAVKMSALKKLSAATSHLFDNHDNTEEPVKA